MIQRIFTQNGKTLVFYKEHNDTKFSFLIDGEPELTELLLANCNTKRVTARELIYAVPGIFSKIEAGLVKPYVGSHPMIKLSEYCQKRWGENIVCEIAQKDGPVYSPTILVKLTLPNGDCYTGSGSNQRIARQLAASAAMDFLGI